jgi:SAM-dependent methyltransferase
MSQCCDCSGNSGSKDYFDNLGADWKNLQESYFGEELRDQALETVTKDFDSIEVAVDLGTGNGFMIMGLAGLSKTVIGVDQSQPMLDGAENYLRANGISNFNLIQGTDDSLPLDDASADIATANMYLHHCEDPTAALDEAIRILRPGGRLVITDMEEHDEVELARKMRDRWLGFELETMETWLKAAGFINVDVKRLESTCCTTTESEGEKRAFKLFIATGDKPAPCC